MIFDAYFYTFHLLQIVINNLLKVGKWMEEQVKIKSKVEGQTEGVY